MKKMKIISITYTNKHFFQEAIDDQEEDHQRSSRNSMGISQTSDETTYTDLDVRLLRSGI